LIAAVMLGPAVRERIRGHNQAKEERLMFRFKTSFVALALGLITPTGADAANFCLAVNGGFGNGGYTFVAPGFAVPAKNQCAAFSGFTKAGSTVVLISNGTGCVSNNGARFDLSIFSTNIDFLGPGVFAFDTIRLCLTSCRFTSDDISSNSSLGGGFPEQVPCTPNLLTIPANHD
jgi:hypothetical protein